MTKSRAERLQSENPDIRTAARLEEGLYQDVIKFYDNNNISGRQGVLYNLFLIGVTVDLERGFKATLNLNMENRQHDREDILELGVDLIKTGNIANVVALGLNPEEFATVKQSCTAMETVISSEMPTYTPPPPSGLELYEIMTDGTLEKVEAAGEEALTYCIFYNFDLS